MTAETDVPPPREGRATPLARWWARLSAGQRVAVAVVAGVVAVNVALVGLRSAVGGDPGGPVSSSLSTGAGGLEAMADLAREAGHPVRSQRETPAEGSLPADAVVVVVDPEQMSEDDFRAIVRHAADGGQLVLAGEAATPILRAVAAPEAGRTRVEPAAVLTVDDDGRFAPLRELAGDEGGRWTGVESLTTHVTDDEGRAVLVSGPAGSGTVTALADAELLHNGTLAQADNAGLALLLLGDADRPVVFLESVHGFGATGLDALPSSWKWAGAGALLALAVGLWWAASRLGPPEPGERALRPARRVHVEAVAAGLDQVGAQPADLVEPLVRANRRALAERLGVASDASEAVWEAAARAAGLDLSAVAAACRPPHDLPSALAVGAAAASRQRAALGPAPTEDHPAYRARSDHPLRSIP